MKYVICRPHGGFNDLLCQISKCWQYSIKTNRRLIILSDRSGMLDSMSNYFEKNDLYDFQITNIDESDSVFPEELSGKLKTYQVKFSPANHVDPYYGAKLFYRETETGVAVAFNPTLEYSHDILVWEQSGGGIDSAKFIEHLRIKKELSTAIKTFILQLGSYTAIHIRNTDYQTDFKPYLVELQQKITGKLVICTDDKSVQSFARDLFGDSVIFTCELPTTNGKSLHNNSTLDRYQVNSQMLFDLCVLGASEKLYFPCITKEFVPGIPGISGYSRLADSLNKNKTLLYKFLG